ncbi:hypothetical protein KKE60_07190, partial [Patescibacteria group bacterium]|nr:hypothetical protein [Patescibacteria group bacterium]
SGITQWLLGAIEHDGRKVSPDEKTRLVKALGFTDWRELMGTHSHHSHAVDNMGFLSEETKNGMKVDLDAELERLRILRTAIDSQE